MTPETTVATYVDEAGFNSRIFVGENPAVHIYAKGAAPDKFPVTAKAPIITQPRASSRCWILWPLLKRTPIHL